MGTTNDHQSLGGMRWGAVEKTPRASKPVVGGAPCWTAASRFACTQRPGAWVPACAATPTDAKRVGTNELYSLGSLTGAGVSAQIRKTPSGRRPRMVCHPWVPEMAPCLRGSPSGPRPTPQHRSMHSPESYPSRGVRSGGPAPGPNLLRRSWLCPWARESAGWLASGPPAESMYRSPTTLEADPPWILDKERRRSLSGPGMAYDRAAHTPTTSCAQTMPPQQHHRAAS
jgi:hypothetical protein